MSTGNWILLTVVVAAAIAAGKTLHERRRSRRRPLATVITLQPAELREARRARSAR